MHSPFIEASVKKSFVLSTLLLSFIWPIGGLSIGLLNYKNDWAKNIFWLFCVFFGYTFIIATDGGPDSYYYAMLLKQYGQTQMNFKELWSSFYSESSGYVDIASPLIIYLVSCVTSNPRILFSVFGLIFGYFFSRNLWYLLDRINGKSDVIVLLYILTFALCNPIWNINGFRMGTASQIFLFGTLPYLLEGRKDRLLWAIVAMLFHFSFMFPLVSLFLFFFLRNKPNIYLAFYLITFVIKEIDLQSAQSALAFLPDVFQPRVSGYTNLEYAEERNLLISESNWYASFYTKGLEWVTVVMTLFIYLFGRKRLESRKDLMTLFCYSLLMYSFANISSQIPSGGRFLVVANTFMFAFYAIYISAFHKIKGFNFIKVLTIPLILLFLIVAIREGMDYYGLSTIIGNPLTAGFYFDRAPLIIGIKELFQ